MGIIIAKFRKEKSTYDILEKLDKEIKSIDEFKRSTEVSQKKIIRRFLLLAGSIYILLLAILFFYFNRFSNYQRVFGLIPLLLLPFVIWFMKSILTWYYNKKIRKNENKLVSLKEQKKKILNNVMETETYKVAKKILDKFGQEPKAISENTPSKALTPRAPQSIRLSDTGLRQRYVPQARGRLSFGNPISPENQRNQMMPTPNRSMHLVKKVSNVSTMSVPGPPLSLARGILPRDRSVLDKMVDYLVGDGPENRFALICKQCSSHNGMALKEEFEYLAFRCCYCSTFNPARKKKPTAPKLELSSPRSIKANSDTSDSDSEKSSNSNSEDNGPIITEPDDHLDADKSSDDDKRSDATMKGTDTASTPMDIDVAQEVTNIETLDKPEIASDS